MRKDLPDIVRELSSLEGVRNVGVTTNGINLKRKLPALREAGLTHINVSVSCLALCVACVDVMWHIYQSLRIAAYCSGAQSSGTLSLARVI